MLEAIGARVVCCACPYKHHVALKLHTMLIIALSALSRTTTLSPPSPQPLHHLRPPSPLLPVSLFHCIIFRPVPVCCRPQSSQSKP
eukprot:359622-Chlamydomonas_euryale.AAC.24